jgi:hypothetical protein
MRGHPNGIAMACSLVLKSFDPHPIVEDSLDRVVAARLRDPNDPSDQTDLVSKTSKSTPPSAKLARSPAVAWPSGEASA